MYIHQERRRGENDILNRVRPSVAVESEKRQPCLWRTSLIKSRPMPCPLTLVEKNGLKSMLAVSSEIPAPLSVTVIIGGFDDVATIILPL